MKSFTVLLCLWVIIGCSSIVAEPAKLTAEQVKKSTVFVRNRPLTGVRKEGIEIYLLATRLGEVLTEEELERVTVDEAGVIYAGDAAVGHLRQWDGHDWMPLLAILRELKYRVVFASATDTLDCYSPAAGMLPAVSASRPNEGYSGYSYSSSPSGGSPGGDVYVRGYYRKDGTYVQSHTRSKPRK